MDKIKKMIMLAIPMSICNFRCSYCYLSQRDACYQGEQPVMQYSPKQVAKALSVERIGGKAFINFCADGETLLTKDLDLYVKELVKQGHYAEIVTNLTVTPALDRILQWEKELLTHVEFKCSFHYLELKKKNLLDIFAKNVNKIWQRGASACIELTPSDELVPYIEEVKEFSMHHFGALTHVTIARDDRTKNIDYLTSLPMQDYDAAWSKFHSEFFQYKKSIFGKKQTGFCYAGKWSICINLATGEAKQCYGGKKLCNVFAYPDAPFPEQPIAKCPLAHCYNGHAFLKLGMIPSELSCEGYGDIRNRTKTNGENWLSPELLAFFNTNCSEANCELTKREQNRATIQMIPYEILKKGISKIKKSHL